MSGDERKHETNQRGRIVRRHRESHQGRHHPQSPDYTPRELDPLAHPKREKDSIERERARPRDTGRGGA